MKEWTYPTNTVEPTTGVPTSACSWSISGRADKDRYFKEPGYIVGLTVARPKTLRPTTSDLSNYFLEYQHWLPAQVMHNPEAGRVGSSHYTNDLFEYGGQFVNYDPNGAYKSNVLLWTGVTDATAGGTGVYPVESSMNSSLWKAPAANNVRQDGKVQLNILTDLPPDQNIGASANQEPAVSEATSVGDLATEYLAKLKEKRAGKATKLPDIRATLEKLLPNVSSAS
jgi:hypothetical protein